MCYCLTVVTTPGGPQVRICDAFGDYEQYVPRCTMRTLRMHVLHAMEQQVMHLRCP